VPYASKSRRHSRSRALADGRSDAAPADLFVARLGGDLPADCGHAAGDGCRNHSLVDHGNRPHRESAASADAPVSHDARGRAGRAGVPEIAATLRRSRRFGRGVSAREGQFTRLSSRCEGFAARAFGWRCYRRYRLSVPRRQRSKWRRSSRPGQARVRRELRFAEIRSFITTRRC